MNTIYIWLFIIILGLISFFIFGIFDICLHALLHYFDKRLKAYRRHQRPARIFIVRHGQSQGNLDTTLYSRVADHEIELSELGHEQAVEAGKKIRSVVGNESVYVYMSPYTRSKQTWINIRKSFSPIQIIKEREDPRLREQEFGNLANLEVRPKEFEDRDRIGHFFYRFSCGESGADVYDRVTLFLDTLYREVDNGYHEATQNIIIVSHELFMRLFLMRYFRWTVNDLKDLKTFENCEICQLTKVDGGYTLDGLTKPLKATK